MKGFELPKPPVIGQHNMHTQWLGGRLISTVSHPENSCLHSFVECVLNCSLVLLLIESNQFDFSSDLLLNFVVISI